MSRLSKKMMPVALERHELVFDRLPRAFDGFNILQLSDLHFARAEGHREAAAREYVESLQPDAVVITGDFANRLDAWPHVDAWLSSLNLPARTYAVPGNWEYKIGLGAQGFRERLEQHGIRVLCNTSERVVCEGGEIHMIGFDDVRDGVPDIAAAFSGVASSSFRIGLCHNPDILLSASAKQFDLLLCGHTHGGQICLPGWGAIFTSTKLGKRFESGLYEPERQHYVYVSRGMGTVNVPWRLFCPPEVGLITLRSGHDSGVQV